MAATSELAAAAAGYAVDAFVVGGVAWPYIAQASAMRKAGDASGFDTRASLIVMASATLRVFYWIALPPKEKFGTPLLVQAVVAVLAQLYLLKAVVEITNKPSHAAAGASLAKPRVERSFLDFRLSDFWKWTDIGSYVMAEVWLIVAAMLVTGALKDYAWFAPALGALSLGIEALLPVPQAVSHWQRKSTAGFSPMVIGAWFAGDAFKTVYAAAKGEPLPFLLCGAFQLCCDILILVQMLMLYRVPSSGSPKGRAQD